MRDDDSLVQFSGKGGYDKWLSWEDILKKEPNMFASGGEKYKEVNDDSRVFA